MSEKFSTELVNFLMGEGSFRKCFEDSVIRVYSGSAPADADDAIPGTSVLLLELTKNGATISSNERSTPKVYKVIVGSHASGETFKFDVTVDGVGPTTYTYTNTPDLDLDGVTTAISQMLNDIPQLDAIPTHDSGDGEIFVKGRIDGLDFTLAIAAAPGTGTITSVTETLALSRSDALQFGAPVAGVINKNSDVWSGDVIVSGTAGFFRVVRSNDDGTESTTQPRAQGTVATSGAEIIASGSAVLTEDAPIRLTSFSMTFPKS